MILDNEKLLNLNKQIIDADEKAVFVFSGFFVITDFMQKQKVKTNEKQMFDNALIE
jgi:hypothetical protein